MKRSLPVFSGLRHYPIILDEAEAVIDAIKSGNDSVKRTRFSEELVTLITRYTQNTYGHLNIPFDIVTRILLLLPIRQCWRISTQLNKRYRTWVCTVIDHFHVSLITEPVNHALGWTVFRKETTFRFDMTHLCLWGFQCIVIGEAEDPHDDNDLFGFFLHDKHICNIPLDRILDDDKIKAKVVWSTITGEKKKCHQEHSYCIVNQIKVTVRFYFCRIVVNIYGGAGGGTSQLAIKYPKVHGHTSNPPCRATSGFSGTRTKTFTHRVRAQAMTSANLRSSNVYPRT